MSLFYYVRFFLFFLGCLIHCHVQFVACTFVTCFNKDQSISQMPQSSTGVMVKNEVVHFLWPTVYTGTESIVNLLYHLLY